MSKDYSVIDGICRNFEYEAKTIFNKGYNQGVEDTKYEKEKAYEQGLNDAWMCVRKLMRGLNYDERNEIFGCTDQATLIGLYSASEVIAKIKAWEDKQTDDEIKVGDEVYLIEGYPRIVTTVFMDSVLGEQVGTITSSGNYATYKIKDIHKTGRHFDQISEVLEQMRGEE